MGWCGWPDEPAHDVACHPKVKPPILKRMELPVVSIELPPGDVDDTAARQPSSGQLMIKNAAGRGGIVLLGWDASEAYTYRAPRT